MSKCFLITPALDVTENMLRDLIEVTQGQFAEKLIPRRKKKEGRKKGRKKKKKELLPMKKIEY